MRFAKTRNTTCQKCSACHAKWHLRSQKCCSCHEKCNASSENVAKVMHLPRKTFFDTSWNMLEYHEVPRLPREMKLCDAGKLEKWPHLHNLPKARPYSPHADGCERLRTADGCGTSGKHSSNPSPPEWNGNTCYAFGKKSLAFTHKSFCTQKILYRKSFRHKSFYTQKSLHTDKSFCTAKVLHTEAIEPQTGRSFVTQKLSRREVLDTKTFAHGSFYTDQHWHTAAFTHRSFCTQKILHRKSFRHKSLYTQKSLHTEKAFVQQRFYTQKLLKLRQGEALSHRDCHAEKL